MEVQETRRPVEGLLVSAFDKDLAFDDHLGVAVTDSEGRFVIRFTEDQFQDIFRDLTEVERTLSDMPTDSDVPWPAMMADKDIYDKSKNKHSV